MRPIDADALIADLTQAKLTADTLMSCEVQKMMSFIDEQPTADVRENVHAVWEKKWHSLYKTKLPCCPICNLFSVMRWDFCPNCGAEMRKETEDAEIH